MYVCTYVRTYVCMYLHTYVQYAHRNVHVVACVAVDAYARLCTHARTNARTHARTHTHTHMALTFQLGLGLRPLLVSGLGQVEPHTLKLGYTSVGEGALLVQAERKGEVDINVL